MADADKAITPPLSFSLVIPSVFDSNLQMKLPMLPYQRPHLLAKLAAERLVFGVGHVRVLAALTMACAAGTQRVVRGLPAVPVACLMGCALHRLAELSVTFADRL